MIEKRRNRTCRAALGVCALIAAGSLLLGAGSAAGQAVADKPPEKPKGWESVASIGVSLTRGNSENFMATLGFNTARKWAKDEVLLGATAAYGESTTKDFSTGSENRNTTDQYVKGFGQGNHLFSERFYGGLRLDGIYDEIAGIDYRFIVSPLAGYYIVKQPRMFLAAEAGPSFVAENLANEPAKQYFGLRLAERFEYKFSDKAKLWQTAEWVPEVKDFANWILNVEIGVAAALSKSLDLRVVLHDSYDNKPSPGREENDLKLIAGIGYKF